MSTHLQSTARGTFSPVSHADGPVRTDEAIELENLSEEEQEVVTADSFIIYGQANIEQWDDPEPGEESIYIEMDALADSLDQLLALENISWEHGDVRVGEPLEEYTLDEGTTVHLDRGESLEFDAGDTLRTQVIREGEPLPDGSGEAQEDALWLVANIYGRDHPGGSRISQSIRLGSYYGHLDGFSVTVDKLEVDPTDEGLVVHDVDFLAVTIGPDDLIKNEGSTYGVVAYEALFAESDDALKTLTGRESAPGSVRAEDSAADGLWPAGEPGPVQQIMRETLRNLFSKSRDGLATEAIRTAHDDEVSLHTAAAEVAPEDADPDQIVELAEEQLETIHDRLEEEAGDTDRETLAAEVADDLGLDKEVVMAAFDQLEAASDDEDDMDNDPEENTEEEQENGPTIESDRDLAEFIADVKDIPVDEAMAMLEGLEGEAATSQLVEEAVADAVDERLDEETAEVDIDTDQFVTEDQLDERLESLQESVSEDLSEKLDGIGENIAENLSEQMATGGTPDPAGGNASSETDLEAEAEQWASFGATEGDD